MTTTTRLRLPPLLLALLLLAPTPARARGFVPNFANGFGFLVPSPETGGGLGCGYFNYINCFPQVTADLRRWSGQLQAVYTSPLAYEPTTKLTVQTPKAAAAEAAALLGAAGAAAGASAGGSAHDGHTHGGGAVQVEMQLTTMHTSLNLPGDPTLEPMK
jgi:hypothetical protein